MKALLISSIMLALTQFVAAAAPHPVLKGDYSELAKPLPTMQRHQDGPWPTISNAEELRQQETAAAEANRVAREAVRQKEEREVELHWALGFGLITVFVIWLLRRPSA